MLYKNYEIDTEFYQEYVCTVQYCGDDIIFNSIEEAKQFIDEITKEVE